MSDTQQQNGYQMLQDLIKANPITDETQKAIRKHIAESVPHAVQNGMSYADIINSSMQMAGITPDIINQKNNPQVLPDSTVNTKQPVQQDIPENINNSSNLPGGLNNSPRFIPSKNLTTQAQITPEGNIQEGGGLSWIGGHNTGTLLKKLLLVSEVNKNSQKSALGELKSQQDAEKKQNAMDIADGIESGNQLADFKSLYGLAGPVKAELQRRGVDVSKLQLQATAETKLAQTLNSPQQVRLNQSIDSVMSGLDELDSLNSEFQRNGIKAFNKGQLEFLANGGGTPQQQELAQKFKTQIIGLQDEFGNVVMGGNSPTDRALELAGKIFNSDFNNTSISAASKQMRRLLSMRKSAITNYGAANGGRASKDGSNSNNTIVNNSSSYNDFRKAIGR